MIEKTVIFMSHNFHNWFVVILLNGYTNTKQAFEASNSRFFAEALLVKISSIFSQRTVVTFPTKRHGSNIWSQQAIARAYIQDRFWPKQSPLILCYLTKHAHCWSGNEFSRDATTSIYSSRISLKNATVILQHRKQRESFNVYKKRNHSRQIQSLSLIRPIVILRQTVIIS